MKSSVDDLLKSIETPPMISVDWESGPLRERDSINISGKVKSWGSAEEKNNNKPEGTLE